MILNNPSVVPAVDGALNLIVRDVVGNKNDTVGGDSLVSLIKSAGGGGDSHTPLFTGVIYYTDGDQLDDTGDGKTPETAKKTNMAAIALMSAGDKLITKAGTYVENITFTLGSMEWEPEIGTVVAPSIGVALTTSGNYCKVSMPDGSLFITPVAGETGVLWSGNNGYPSDIRVNCASSGTIGFDFTGNGIDGKSLRCASPLTAAFKIQGDKVKLKDCCTGGEIADTSIGFWVTNSCDKPRFINCNSQGHSVAGFQADTGVSNGIAKDCSSGAGDGPRIDNSDSFHWPGFMSISSVEEHFHSYPTPDGEGTAGDPISVTTDAADETNGPASTANYWGETKVIVSPAVITGIWSWIGVSLFADTAAKIFNMQWLRIDYLNQSAKNGGNAWDEGATVLTVADGSKFVADDLVWIYSDYKTNGEIIRVTGVVGNVVTIEREGSQFGAANTGLRWNHTTNDPGTEVMYRVRHETRGEQHDTNIQASFGSAKDSVIKIFGILRGFRADDGLIARMCNMTDGTNGATLDTSIIYREGGY